jgi:hypothetical protein
MKARRGISGEQMVSMSSLVGSGRESTSVGGGVDGVCRSARRLGAWRSTRGRIVRKTA